jgi:hypothetical protein
VQVPRIACNVDCPDGPCVVRAGLPPTVIAAAPPGDHVGALATGANALYYGTIARDFYTAGELRQAPLAGGPSSLLVSGVAVASIRIDLQGTIYFVADEARSSATRLWSFAGAGPAKVSDVNDYGMVAVPTHDGQVWVEKAELMGGFIAWHDPDGSFSRVAELKGTPHGFALDGTNLYWADGDGPSHISTIRTDDGNVDEYGFVMTTATDVLASPIAAGADLYFLHAHAPGDCQGSVMVMPTAGGQPILVSLGHSGSDVSSLAVDGGFVYWTTPDAGGLVFRAARGGGTPEVIATEQAGARAVAAGAGRVYWIAVGAGGDEVRAVAP